jgi:hypothetical protein
MRFPVIVRLAKEGSLWEPRSLQNFWKVGDMSKPLFEGTDFTAIKRLVKSGKLEVVAGSLEDEPAPVVEEAAPATAPVEEAPVAKEKPAQPKSRKRSK